jgi:hypothetical protein
MPRQPDKPAPKLQATKVPAATRSQKGTKSHDEDVIDEALDESFPASDPAAVVSPSGTLAVKNSARKKK